MEKRLLNYVSTSGSVTIQDAVGIISLLLIGISLLIILYNILKWLIRVDEKMSVLREVVQTYKQLQKEKEEGLSEDKIVP
jgi:hypothetical protein